MYANYRKYGEKQDRIRDHPWITAANIFVYFFHTFLCITNTYKHLSYLWLYCVCVYSHSFISCFFFIQPTEHFPCIKPSS